MTSTQIVTISFFRYEGFSNKWWAFKQMGIAPEQLASIEGLSFSKILGSGAGKGFSIAPNFGVYGLLCVWDSEIIAQQKHSVLEDCKTYSSEYWTTYMRTAQTHGTWDGSEPFVVNENFDKEKLVGVITRATIYTKNLLGFWRFVPKVSRSLEDKTGRIFSIGIGEVPIVQQATFSLWESSEQMMAYAYKSKFHKEVIQKTRELGWYKEELFARFVPYHSEGTWNGSNPLTTYLPN